MAFCAAPAVQKVSGPVSVYRSLIRLFPLATPLSSLQERTVKSVVMQMGVHEVYDVVSNMKQLAEKEPDKTKQMFVSHPQVRTRSYCAIVRDGMDVVTTLLWVCLSVVVRSRFEVFIFTHTVLSSRVFLNSDDVTWGKCTAATRGLYT